MALGPSIESHLTWSVYLVQHSQAFAERSRQNPTMRRVELVNACRESEEEVWDTQFIWTAVAERQQTPVGYSITPVY